VSKEPPATSANPRTEGSEYVFRLNTAKLRHIAKNHGDSSGYAISRRTGISESSVYRILSGAAQPDLNSAMRIAEAYDVDLRRLMKRVPVGVAA
jgi:transcriptional regulator with XRE-family HTH domain